MKLTWAKANTETWLAPIGCAPKDLQNLRLFASLFCCSFYAMDISDKQTQHDWLMMTLKARVIVKEILSIQNRNSSKALPDGESPLTQHHFHGSRFATVNACLRCSLCLLTGLRRCTLVRSSSRRSQSRLRATDFLH